MSLTSVEIRGLRSNATTLPLAPGGSPSTDPLQILGIDGVEPVKATVTTAPFAVFDGESFMGAAVGKRNIVMKFGLNPDWATQTVESLRQLLYQYFMPKVPVRLIFTSTHLPTCQIDGYVEGFDVNIFAKDPEISVSIICPMPNFVAVAPTVITDFSTDGTTFKTIDYEGTVPTGFLLKVAWITGLSGVEDFAQIVVNSPLTQLFTSKGIITSTVRWEMNSNPGLKSVKSIDGSGVETNYLNSVQAGSVWPVLTPGENDVTVVWNSVGEPWTLTYYAQFGGL